MTYTAAGTDLTSGILTILPSDPGATVTVNGQTYDVNRPGTISLPYGTTEWTIVVTNGGSSATYYLVLNNTNLSGGGGPGIEVPTCPVVATETEHGTVTVRPTRAVQGQTVTITATPEEGYRLDSVAVTTENGREIAVTQTGANTYTFTMPSGAVYVAVQFAEGEGGWTNPFTDVAPGAWYYDSVRYVCENGMMNGTSATTLNPKGTATRAEVAAMLQRFCEQNQ